MYMHQRLKGSNAASAVWIKLIAVTVAFPVLLRTGLPQEPMFYIFTGLAAMVWCVNDLIYFRAVNEHGAALLARLSPLGLIAIFIAWFFIRPELLHQYLQDGPRFAAVCAVLLFCVGCAVAVRRCPFSWQALKSIWFVIVASVIGTFLVKEAVDAAPVAKGVFGYVGIEAALMLLFYGAWFSLRDKAGGRAVFSRHGVKTGLVVGGFLVAAIILRTAAQQKVDHPAYVTMISMLDVVWLMVLTPLSGWKDRSNKWAGLGIAASALALAFLKVR